MRRIHSCKMDSPKVAVNRFLVSQFAVRVKSTGDSHDTINSFVIGLPESGGAMNDNTASEISGFLARRWWNCYR